MTFRKMRACVLAGLAMVGLSSQAWAEQSWDDVVKAAKQEGRVTLYTSQVGVPQLDEILSAFSDEYGIEVQKLELRGSELFERLRLELATNRSAADLSFSGGSVTLETMGVLQPHRDIPNAARLSPEFAGNELRLPVFSQSMGIIVNASVPKDKRPKRWADLTDPSWKGKILADDFRAVGGGGLFFAVTYEKFGEDYQKRLSENRPVFTREIRDSPRRVARGEYPVYIPFILPDALLNKGLPLEVILPEEGLVYGNFDAAVVKGAPHPNAARMLLNFFLSDKAQLIYAGSARRPTVKGLEDQYPENVRDFLKAPLLGTQEDAKVRTQMLQRATEMYK